MRLIFKVFRHGVPLGFMAALRVGGPSLAARDLTVQGCSRVLPWRVYPQRLLFFSWDRLLGLVLQYPTFKRFGLL